MNQEKLRELALEVAQGSASEAEQADFQAALAQADEAAHREIAQLFDVSALLALGHRSEPPAGLKQKVIAKIAPRPKPEISPLTFMYAADQSGWRPVGVPGAYAKVLSINREQGYAVVLGKLDPGAKYPAHSHSTGEDIFMVSGELVVGDVKLKAGDFHHAAAGSEHGENYSETGCIVVAVLSLQDLRMQVLQPS